MLIMIRAFQVAAVKAVGGLALWGCDPLAGRRPLRPSERDGIRARVNAPG